MPYAIKSGRIRANFQLQVHANVSTTMEKLTVPPRRRRIRKIKSKCRAPSDVRCVHTPLLRTAYTRRHRHDARARKRHQRENQSSPGVGRGNTCGSGSQSPDHSGGARVEMRNRRVKVEERERKRHLLASAAYVDRARRS